MIEYQITSGHDDPSRINLSKELHRHMIMSNFISDKFEKFKNSNFICLRLRLGTNTA